MRSWGKIEFALTKMEDRHAKRSRYGGQPALCLPPSPVRLGYKDCGYGSYRYREYANYYRAEDED